MTLMLELTPRTLAFNYVDDLTGCGSGGVSLYQHSSKFGAVSSELSYAASQSLIMK